MSVVVRVPPGRSGRMWLERRIATAERGREQLDRKLRLLVAEQQRQRARAATRQQAWAESCGAAQAWFVRASVLGGQDAVRHATPSSPVRVELIWDQSVGLPYPSGARVDPASGVSTQVRDNAAVGPALAAARVAVDAAVQSAVADEAVRRIDAEVQLTRRRLRALDRAWIPALRRAMARLELALDQAEQEDGVRLRRASSTPGNHPQSGSGEPQE